MKNPTKQKLLAFVEASLHSKYTSKEAMDVSAWFNKFENLEEDIEAMKLGKKIIGEF
jgi:hypothetical protein